VTRVYREAMAAPARQRRRLHPGQKKILFGSIALFLGAFLPWFWTNVGNISAIGFSFNASEPVITLAGQPGLWVWYASFLALGSALAPWRLFTIIGAVIAAAVGVGLPLYYLVRAVTGSWFFEQADWLVGPGIVLAVGGAVMCAIGVRELFSLAEVPIGAPTVST